MTIKTATLIALILVALGTLTDVALTITRGFYPLTFALPSLLTGIGLIIFLAVLYSKQT